MRNPNTRYALRAPGINGGVLETKIGMRPFAAQLYETVTDARKARRVMQLKPKDWQIVRVTVKLEGFVK